jgi:hypothetical protein
MTDETKQTLKLYLSLMKVQMKNDGLIFGIAVDKEDFNNSKLCFIEKERYLKNDERDGIMISLSDLNKGLL